YPTTDALFVNFVDTAGASHLVQAGGLFAVGNWYHVVATYDGTWGTLYVNGNQVATVNLGAVTLQTSFPLNVARRPSPTQSYLGASISDVAVYARALAANRVQLHYAAGRPAALVNNGAYKANVMADQPAGYWRLGETSTTLPAADQTAARNAGAYSSAGVTVAQPGALGTDPDPAATFNGSTGYVTTPNQNITGSVTVEAWIYATTYNQHGFIVGKNPVNSNWELFVAANTLYWRSGGNGCGAPTTTYTDLTVPAPTVSTWHHVVATQNGALASLYIDGALVASRSNMASIGVNAGTLEFGRYAAASGYGSNCVAAYYFNGSIDEVAVYPTALSATRVLAHYQSAQLVSQAATGRSQSSYSATVGADRP